MPVAGKRRTAPKKSARISKGSYTPPTLDRVQSRNQREARPDPMWNSEDLTFFTPQEGRNRIRILPPFWGNGSEQEFWSFQIDIHFGIGPDDISYVCPERQKGIPGHKREKCPVCAEATNLHNNGQQEEARQFWPRARRAMWVIDRQDEEAGPKLWTCAKTLDDNIADIAAHPDNNGVLNLCDSNDGFDVLFQREGTGIRTRYTGVTIARKESPLCGDPDLGLEWVEYAEANPIPKLINIYPAEHIQKVFSGEVDEADEEEQESSESYLDDELPDEFSGNARVSSGKRNALAQEPDDEEEDLDGEEGYEDEDGGETEEDLLEEEDDENPPWEEQEEDDLPVKRGKSKVGDKLQRMRGRA